MFGEKLKALRLEQSLKQSDVAKALLISQSTYGKYERGDLEPNLQYLIKLADYFNCSVDYLLGRESEEGIIVVSGDFKLSEVEKTLIKDFRLLPSRQQSLISGLVHGMVS